MNESNFPVNDPDRYKGYSEKSPFGRLLLQSGFIIDLVAGEVTNPRTAHWTDRVNKIECSLEATNAEYTEAYTGDRVLPAAVVSYVLTRHHTETGVVDRYQWQSGEQSINIVDGNGAVFRTSESPALMLTINGNLAQFDRERETKSWEMPSGRNTTTLVSLQEVNAEFDSLIEFNKDFHRKLGRRTLGGTRRNSSDRVMELTGMGMIDAEMFLYRG